MTKYLDSKVAAALPTLCPLLSGVFCSDLEWDQLASLADLRHLEALSTRVLGEPESLRPMPSLRFLDVTCAHGALGPILAQYPGLRTLVLKDFDSDIGPIALELVPDLRILDLEANEGVLSRVLPMENRIQAIFIGCVDDADLDAIAKRCKDLRVLRVGCGMCSPDALKHALRSMGKLEELDIHNGCTERIEAVSESIPLTVKRLHFNHTFGHHTSRAHALMVKTIERCTKLTHVSLLTLPADDMQCMLLSKVLPKLEHLRVGGDELTPFGARLLAERCDYLQIDSHRPLTEAYLRAPRTCFARDYKRFEHEVLNASRRCDEY